MSINFDFGILTDAFQGTDLGIGGALLGVLFSLVSVFVITRNTRHIAILSFPVLVGFSRVGLGIHSLFIIAAGIVWAVTLVGPNTIGSTLSGIAAGADGLQKGTMQFAQQSLKRTHKRGEKLQRLQTNLDYGQRIRNQDQRLRSQQTDLIDNLRFEKDPFTKFLKREKNRLQEEEIQR